MIEALFEFRGFAACHIVHRTTRNKPHHQFNAFASSFPHIVDVRNIGRCLWVADELVQERVVEFFVDQPGERTLQLMTDTTRAPKNNR